jgi:hypothetical protein
MTELIDMMLMRMFLSEYVMRLSMLPSHEITLYQCIVGKLLYTVLILTSRFLLTCLVDIHTL